jgi:hypothetical protein
LSADEEAWALLKRLRHAPYYADVETEDGTLWIRRQRRRLTAEDKQAISRLKPQLIEQVAEAEDYLRRAAVTNWDVPETNMR